jgi:hypothetical protein
LFAGVCEIDQTPELARPKTKISFIPKPDDEMDVDEIKYFETKESK